MCNILRFPNGKLILYNNTLYYSIGGKWNDVQTIDTQLVYTTGYFTGNNDEGNWRTISIGFTPKCVILSTRMGDMSTYYNSAITTGGMACTNCNHRGIQIISNGFQVLHYPNIYQKYDQVYLNSTSDIWNPYRYIAFK